MINNPDKLNLTAYVVTDTNNDVFVTIINKEHGPAARDGMVSIAAPGKLTGVMYLKAPHNNVVSTNAIKLGGSSIDSSGPWQGKWSTLEPATGVKVEASSAAIVRFADGKKSAPEK